MRSIIVLFIKLITSLLSAVYFYLCMNYSKEYLLSFTITSTAIGCGLSVLEFGIITYCIHKGKFKKFKKYAFLLLVFTVIVCFAIEYLNFSAIFSLDQKYDIKFKLTLLFTAIIFFNIRATQYILGERQNQLVYFYLVCAQLSCFFLPNNEFAIYMVLLGLLCIFQSLFIFQKREMLALLEETDGRDKNILFYVITPLSAFAFSHIDKLFFTENINYQATLSLIERIISASSLYVPFVASHWADSREEKCFEKDCLVKHTFYVVAKNLKTIMVSYLAFISAFMIGFLVIFKSVHMNYFFAGLSLFTTWIVFNCLNIILLKKGKMRIIFISQIIQLVVWVAPKVLLSIENVDYILVINVISIALSILFSFYLYNREKIITVVVRKTVID